MPTSSWQNMLFCGNPRRIRNFHWADVGIGPYKRIISIPTRTLPPSPIFGGVMVPRKRNRFFFGRFKGVCKGDRAPTRIQRSDSCGKRRKNGTDEAYPPQAADRMRDVEFVPTQIPLCRFLFTASGFFFAAQRKRGWISPLRMHSVENTTAGGRNYVHPHWVGFFRPGQRRDRRI